MEELNEEYIENEDNEIFNFYSLKKAMNSGTENCVCKIIREFKTNNEPKFISGTGFFCEIPFSNIKVIFTNNHVLDQEFLDNEKKLTYVIDIEKKEIEKEINLELKRIKYTNSELDFTIIEILKEDKITNFLEIDKYFNSKDYKDEHVFSVQFPLTENLKISPGKIINKKDQFFLYTLGTDKGSSGSPIILINNSKVIGLHKAKYNKDKKRIINLGIPMKLIIKKIYQKVNVKAKLLNEINTSLNKLIDLFNIKEIPNPIQNSINKKLRVTVGGGDICVGKATILNCIIGENIISINNEISRNYGIILQYQDTNEFYLYKTNLIQKKSENYFNDFFFENQEDFEIKGVNNIKSYLNDKNKEFHLIDNKVPIFIIKGKLKIFNFIELDKEIIDRIEFIELPNIQSKNFEKNNFLLEYRKNIIELSECIIHIISPDLIDDEESLCRIRITYMSYKERQNPINRKFFIKNCLFLVNKSDCLIKKEKEKEKIEKKLFQTISEVEYNLTSDNMNISFFSGKIFIHYLQIYNDYIEKLENETIYFFEKIIKEFKEISKYSDTNILLENFFLEKLNQIIKEFNLNFNKFSNIPEKFKNNLIDSLNKTIKKNNIEINDKKKKK